MPVVGKRLLFGAIGVAATIVAVIGVWLPGVPTVFPLIIALWAFSKSSVRLKQWVEQLPLLKHALREAGRFEQDRSVDRRVKLIAVASAWVSTLVVMVTTRNVVAAGVVAGVAVACSIFMMIIPTRVQEPVE